MMTITPITNTSKKLIAYAGAISSATAIFGALLIKDTAHYATNVDFITLVGGRAQFVLGVFLGCLVATIKILHIDASCKKVLEMDALEGKITACSRYFARFLFTGVFLFVSVTTPQISFLGAVLGVLSLRLSVFFVSLKSGVKRGETD